MTNVEATRLVKFYLVTDREDTTSNWRPVKLEAEVILGDDDVAYKAYLKFGVVGKIYDGGAEFELENVRGLDCGGLSRVTPEGKQCYNVKLSNGSKVATLAEATTLRLGLWAGRSRLPKGAEDTVLQKTSEWKQAVKPATTRKGTMPCMWANFYVAPGATLTLEEFGWQPIDPSKVIREAL